MSHIEISSYKGTSPQSDYPRSLTRGQEMPLQIGGTHVVFRYGENGVITIIKPNGLPFNGLPTFSDKSGAIVVFPQGAIEITPKE